MISSITLRMLAIKMKYKGFFESPRPLKIAEIPLYPKVNKIPRALTKI